MLQRFVLTFCGCVLSCGVMSAAQETDVDRPVEIGPVSDFSCQGHYGGPVPIPDIVRHELLPNRMHLDPWITRPEVFRRMDDRLLPLFLRVLHEANDTEIQIAAAYSLARVAELKLGDVKPAEPDLTKLLRESQSDAVRKACAYLAVRGEFRSLTPELLKMTETANDDVRMFIESALTEWKTAEAKDMWQKRLADPDVTDVACLLATQGLVALEDQSAAEALAKLVRSEATEFGIRMAAARALAVLNPEGSLEAGKALISRNIPSKLLAVTLLDSKLEAAWSTATVLCPDSSNGVASAAWQMIFRRKPELLQEHLALGRGHADPEVRMTAARTIRMFPLTERVSWLNEQLSDIHIQVRNLARQMLLAVSREHAEFQPQIVDEASRGLPLDAKNWQGTEQCLVLLGQLKASQFSAATLPLLNHPREEVCTSAAWLLHLFPDASLAADIQKHIEANESILVSGQEGLIAAKLKQQFLFQYAGIIRLREIEPILMKKFNKMLADGPMTRAAAMWTLGLLHEKSADAALAAQFSARIRDRDSMPPEYLPVRRMSVMALGFLRAGAETAALRETFQMDDPGSLIVGQAHWVLRLLGEQEIPPIPELVSYTGGWNIRPVSKYNLSTGGNTEGGQ